MRIFIITSPGLSVGRPGQRRTDEQLGMTDDQIDQFCEAGHAVEVYGTEGPAVGRVAVDEPVDEPDAITERAAQVESLADQGLDPKAEKKPRGG